MNSRKIEKLQAGDMESFGFFLKKCLYMECVCIFNIQIDPLLNSFFPLILLSWLSSICIVTTLINPLSQCSCPLPLLLPPFHPQPSINPYPPLGSPLCAAAGYLEPVLTLDSTLDKYPQLKNHKTNGRPKLSVFWQGVCLSGLTAASYSAQVTSHWGGEKKKKRLTSKGRVGGRMKANGGRRVKTRRWIENERQEETLTETRMQEDGPVRK